LNDGVSLSIYFRIIIRIVPERRTDFVFLEFLQVFLKDPCTHMQEFVVPVF